MRITIEQRIARVSGSPVIICGNSGYYVTFDFDAEWSEYTEKTAHFRFIRDGTPAHIGVPFQGTVCEIPVLRGIGFVEIGVSAGSIRTTTPARIPCAYCATDIPSAAYEARPDIYNQLMQQLAEHLNHLPPLPAGYVFVVTAEGDYVTTSAGDYVIAKE